MTHTRSLTVLGFLFASLNACAPTVIDGTGSGGGGVSTGDDPTTSSGPATCDRCANAIAIRYGDIPPITGGDVGSTSTGTGGGPDPDMILLIVSNQLVSCDDPWSAGIACGSWAVYLDLPPGVQAPANMTLQDANGFVSESGPNGDGTCWGGGGSFWDGELAIDTVDAATIAGTLSGTDTFEFNANGAFTAMRCTKP